MALISKIDQLRQIKASASYADVDLGDNNADRSTLVEGAASLQEDLNNIRSQILDILGSDATKWSDLPSTTLTEVAGASKKMFIQGVQVAITGVNGSSVELAQTNSINGTANTNDPGIVNEAHDATLAVGSKATAIIRDKATNEVIVDVDEREIFGIVQHEDPSTDENKLYLKFFVDDDGTLVERTITGDIEVILPDRQNLKDLSETAFFSNAGFAGAVGAFEIGDRVWKDVNSTDGTPIYNFVENEDITKTINKIAAVGGPVKNLNDNISAVTGITSDTFNTTFKTDNADSYLEDGDTLYDAIKKLDVQAKRLQDEIDNVSADKVISIITESIAEGTAITLPDSKTYDNADKDALDVYVNGQLLVSDAVAGGDGKGDYAETSNTEITFHMPIEPGDVITYKIYKA